MGLGIKIPKNALSKGREEFAKGDDFGNVELEPGRYLMQIQGARGVETSKGPNIVFDLKVVGEGEKVGGKVGIFFSLAEDRVVWLFRVIDTLGYEIPEQVDEKFLGEIVDDITTNKPVVRVKVSRTGDYINYRIEKLVTDVAVTDGESAVDTNAGSVQAGRSEEVVKAKTQAPKAAPKAEAPPPVEETEPAAEEPAAEEVVEEEETVLDVGSKVKANIKGAVHDVTVTALHAEEQKITCRSAVDGKLYKVGLDKLI